jgi:hypothetical protein
MELSDLKPLFHGRNPLRLADGKLGLIVHLGHGESVAVQVDGEECLRWVPYGALIHAGDGWFVETTDALAIEKRSKTMQCTVEFWEALHPAARLTYFSSKLDTDLYEAGFYRAGPVSVSSDYEKVKAATGSSQPLAIPHVTVRIEANSAAMLRPRRKTKTPSAERERLESVG